VAVMVVGYQEGPSADPSTRTRKPLADFVFSGSWGRAAAVVAENYTQGEEHV
jgi:hypothetical protein